MSSYFLACARSAPAVVAASPDAVALLQVQGVAPLGVTDDVDDGDALIPATADPHRVPVGHKGRRVDRRHIDHVISQTRALLDGPHAADLRLHLKREDALQAKAMSEAQRQALRAAEIDERNEQLLQDIERDRLAAAAQAAEANKSVTPASVVEVPERSASTHGPAPVYVKHPLSTHALDHTDIDDAVQAGDAFRLLRIEEVRVRLEAQRQQHTGGSIVARYAVEDAFLADASNAAKAEALVDYPSAQALRKPKPVTASSLFKIGSVAEYRNNNNHASASNSDRRADGSASPLRLGLTIIDEATAEARAKEKAQQRLDALRAASACDESLAARVRAMEERETQERQSRAQHSNEERQRALDETRALANASRRKAMLIARRDGVPYDGPTADESAANPTVVGSALIVGLQPGSSLLRAAPSGRDGHLESNESRETARALKLTTKPLHPIDAYQQKVRADLLRERGWDDESLVDASPTAEMSLLALAEQHQRVAGQLHLRGI